MRSSCVYEIKLILFYCGLVGYLRTDLLQLAPLALLAKLSWQRFRDSGPLWYLLHLSGFHSRGTWPSALHGSACQSFSAVSQLANEIRMRSWIRGFCRFIIGVEYISFRGSMWGTFISLENLLLRRKKMFPMHTNINNQWAFPAAP